VHKCGTEIVVAVVLPFSAVLMLVVMMVAFVAMLYNFLGVRPSPESGFLQKRLSGVVGISHLTVEVERCPGVH
jgi:hypothetical protein